MSSSNSSVLRIFGISAALSVCIGALSGCPQRSDNLGEKTIHKFSKEPTISLYQNDTGKKVNLPIETYLEGVVAGEMLPNWPEEAYAAQAIVARTFTLELLSRTGGTKKLHGTDMSTDEKETQAYNAKAITPIIKNAVKKTRGKVLAYDNRYIRAWFHSAAGTKTARAKEGLNIREEEPPYTQSVVSPEGMAPPEYKSWSAAIPLAEIQAALGKTGKAIGNISNIEITGRGPSGRVTEFSITHANGRDVISGADLRILVGPEKMRSTLLDSFSVESGQVKMSGKGFGHGVGMSQWGAYTMAKQGANADQIVSKYFKDVRIEKLWD